MDKIPFIPSDNNYRLAVSFDNTQYLLDVYWNSRDAAWYFDFREQDTTPIAMGLKIVLGGNLGRRCQHPFFKNHVLTVIDTTSSKRDAAYDDLGARIIVVHTSVTEITRRSP